jgi:hypothetical protein
MMLPFLRCDAGTETQLTDPLSPAKDALTEMFAIISFQMKGDTEIVPPPEHRPDGHHIMWPEITGIVQHQVRQRTITLSPGYLCRHLQGRLKLALQGADQFRLGYG